MTLDIRGINDIRLISKPVHAPFHKLKGTDDNTILTEVVNKRIWVELLGIREDSVYRTSYARDICIKTKVWWDMKPCSWESGSLRITAIFSVCKSVR